MCNYKRTKQGKLVCWVLRSNWELPLMSKCLKCKCKESCKQTLLVTECCQLFTHLSQILSSKQQCGIHPSIHPSIPQVVLEQLHPYSGIWPYNNNTSHIHPRLFIYCFPSLTHKHETGTIKGQKSPEYSKSSSTHTQAFGLI
jgi:hypothetical protein